MENSGLTLSQEGYLLADALRETSKMIFYLLAILIGFILVGIWAIFSPDTSFSVPFLRFWLPYVIALTSIFMIYYYTRYRKFSKNLYQWKVSYLEQAYYLIFDTTVPKGTDTGEKVLNLAKLVFPELRSDYVRFSPYYTDHIRARIKKLLHREDALQKGLDIGRESYRIDLAYKTLKGYFVVKCFSDETVTLAHLKHYLKLISRRFKNNYQRTFVFRAICVAKYYDPSFLTRESLNKVMTEELRSSIKIDLLIDDGKGYSVLWVT